MSDNHTWDGEPLLKYSVSNQSPGRGLPKIMGSIIGVACFALAGLAVTTVLAGKDEPQTRSTAYFVNGQIVTDGRSSLDLSRPIFVRSNVPICPSEDALATYSAGDSQGCTTLASNAPAGLVGIVTDGMRPPTFQMRMRTPDGTVQGWVDYNNLTN
jgi:hypothetical protein